jgi:hypothetical protein
VRLRPRLHGDSVYQGLTVGYVLALTQFVMVFGLGVFYLRVSNRTFDPLAAAAIAQFADAAPAGPQRSGRFRRSAGAPSTTMPSAGRPAR